MRVVFDASVVVSAGSGGPSLDALTYAFSYGHVYTSPELIQELETLPVRLSGKIGRKRTQALQTLISQLLEVTRLKSPRRRFRVCRDPKDDPYLWAAARARRDS